MIWEVPCVQKQKKIAVLNDLSGFGRCSLTVAIPILSAMGMQCCPVPTAVFSNHTGYDSFYRVDFSAHLPAYFDEWEKLGLKFDGVLIGFLGSERQLALTERFLERFSAPETVVVLDPAMGDGGALYPGYAPELAAGMHRLAAYADVLTPNLTEAAILTGRPYCEVPDERELAALTAELQKLGAKDVVISGLERGELLANYLRAGTADPQWISHRRTGASRCGTGDVFSAIVAGGIVRGMTLHDAVQLAARLIAKAIAYTDALDTPPQDGVCFEPFLRDLCPKIGC